MKRLLLVDDDEPLRRVLGRTLERAGYSVLTAANGAEALKLYQQEPVDLVITDLVMPEKEGFETIMELKRLQRDLKIIAISGGGRGDAGDYLPVARHLGAAKVLAKPFSMEEILQAIRELLG
jgi:CheY-like chemotaxis protein